MSHPLFPPSLLHHLCTLTEAQGEIRITRPKYAAATPSFPSPPSSASQRKGRQGTKRKSAPLPSDSPSAGGAGETSPTHVSALDPHSPSCVLHRMEVWGADSPTPLPLPLSPAGPDVDKSAAVAPISPSPSSSRPNISFLAWEQMQERYDEEEIERAQKLWENREQLKAELEAAVLATEEAAKVQAEAEAALQTASSLAAVPQPMEISADVATASSSHPLPSAPVAPMPLDLYSLPESLPFSVASTSFTHEPATASHSLSSAVAPVLPLSLAPPSLSPSTLRRKKREAAKLKAAQKVHELVKKQLEESGAHHHHHHQHQHHHHQNQPLTKSDPAALRAMLMRKNNPKEAHEKWLQKELQQALTAPTKLPPSKRASAAVTAAGAASSRASLASIGSSSSAANLQRLQLGLPPKHQQGAGLTKKRFALSTAHLSMAATTFGPGAAGSSSEPHQSSPSTSYKPSARSLLMQRDPSAIKPHRFREVRRVLREQLAKDTETLGLASSSSPTFSSTLADMDVDSMTPEQLQASESSFRVRLQASQDNYPSLLRAHPSWVARHSSIRVLKPSASTTTAGETDAMEEGEEVFGEWFTCTPAHELEESYLHQHQAEYDWIERPHASLARSGIRATARARSVSASRAEGGSAASVGKHSQGARSRSSSVDSVFQHPPPVSPVPLSTSGLNKNYLPPQRSSSNLSAPHTQGSAGSGSAGKSVAGSTGQPASSSSSRVLGSAPTQGGIQRGRRHALICQKVAQQHDRALARTPSPQGSTVAKSPMWTGAMTAPSVASASVAQHSVASTPVMEAESPLLLQRKVPATQRVAHIATAARRSSSPLTGPSPTPSLPLPSISGLHPLTLRVLHQLVLRTLATHRVPPSHPQYSKLATLCLMKVKEAAFIEDVDLEADRGEAEAVRATCGHMVAPAVREAMRQLKIKGEEKREMKGTLQTTVTATATIIQTSTTRAHPLQPPTHSAEEAEGLMSPSNSSVLQVRMATVTARATAQLTQQLASSASSGAASPRCALIPPSNFPPTIRPNLLVSPPPAALAGAVPRPHALQALTAGLPSPAPSLPPSGLETPPVSRHAQVFRLLQPGVDTPPLTTSAAMQQLQRSDSMQSLLPNETHTPVFLPGDSVLSTLQSVSALLPSAKQLDTPCPANKLTSPAFVDKENALNGIEATRNSKRRRM